MTILIFLVFYYFLYFCGRGSLILLKFIKNKNSQEIDTFIEEQKTFFPILTFFILGNVVFISNFFISIKVFFPFLITFCIFLIFFNFFDTKRVSLSLNNLINQLIIPILLSVSTYGINFHGDAAAYHLNAQLWLREEPIVFGISNITWTYGYQSIFEYISSVFWIQDNFVFLHFINVIFMVLFFSFISDNVLNKKSNFLFYSSILIVSFGILDNFGIDGGKNGFVVFQSIGKFDISFAIIFTITNILIFDNLKNNKFKNNEFFLIVTLSLFAFQLKVFGIYLIIPLIYYFYFYSLNIKKLIAKIYPFVFILIFWLLKYLINTSCLIYPVIFTCISSLDWHTNGWVQHLVNDVRIFHNSYNFRYNFFRWFEEWRSFGENNTTIFNFIGSFFLIYLSTIFFTRKEKKLSKINFFLFLYLSFLILIWLYSSPEIRFGISIFLLLISALSLNIKQFRFEFLNNIVNKKTLAFLIISSCFLVVRLDSYKNVVSKPFIFYEINIPSIEYVENTSSWNVVPKDNIYECWINIDCVPASWTTYRSRIGNNLKITSNFDSYP